MAPHSNECLDPEANKANQKYPLKLHLWQSVDFFRPMINFERRTFLSRLSIFLKCFSAWVAHAKNLAIQQINDLGLNSKSLVERGIKRWLFVAAFCGQGYPVFGVETTKSTFKKIIKALKYLEFLARLWPEVPYQMVWLI